ncbi:MAG: LysR family transcriptional regulator [Proteobacteria bacterium]|nr:LysR family transcriptional regulator [Pseudomonadota bacterium]
MINLNEMVVFERVVHEGGFSPAARALGLSKASVSVYISRLEERLGARLLERTTRRVRLTEVGEAYYQSCVRIVTEAREADLSVSHARLVPQGVLRLTAPHLFGDAFLTPIIAEYLRRHPDVSVDLVLAERHIDLIEENFDLAIRIGTLANSQLIARKLGEARSLYCASREYIREHGQPLVPGDLADHQCILVGHALRQDWPFTGRDGSAAVSVVGRFNANSLVMGRDAALLHRGIAYLPAFLCGEYLARGELVEVLAEHCPGPYSLYAIYPSNRHLSAKVRSFLDLLIEETTLSPPWASPG